MGMFAAISHEIKRRRVAREKQRAVMDSLPENPPRGSYYWWARMAREVVAMSYLDSGMYGYGFTAGVPLEDGPQMWLTLFDGVPEAWGINTIGWLNTMLDATDEVAIALEEVIDWIGEWLYPTASWGKVLPELPTILNMLYACIWENGRRTIFHKVPTRGYWKSRPRNMHRIHGWAAAEIEPGTVYADWIVRYYAGKLTYASQFKKYQRDMPANEFYDTALDELPVKAVKLLCEKGVRKNGDGKYTYGTDTSLTQDISIDLVFADEYGDSYVIVRTHNGADSRGGFSEPVAAKVYDSDYFGECREDGFCTGCGEQFYDGMFRYKQAFGKGIPQPPIEAWRRWFRENDQIQAGQLTLGIASMDWEWTDTQAVARAILNHYDEDPEADFPFVVCANEDGAYFPGEGYETIPDENVIGMLCPNCGSYNVNFHSSVYGW